jgi:light-regulated signal transduction histidine kinase (bacteriophytochrome)
LAYSNDELRKFAYVASHDLQEPLRVVTSFGQLLQRDYRGKLDEKADEWIDYIVDGGRRMQQLIQDLLGYTRIESQARPFKRVDLGQVLEHVLANLRASIDDTSATITHQELPTVLADEPQMIQLLQNLVSNAIKFHDSAPPFIQIDAKRDGDFWTVSVADNGIGIAPNHSERVFEFFTRLNSRQEFPGTGIGLPICQRVVQRHGGRIWLQSSPGQGSTFFFTLPVESLS